MKIALAQMDVRFGAVEENLRSMLDKLHESRRAGAELTIFPECALTGYCFESLDEARPFAQPVPGPAVAAFSNVLSEIGGAAIFGMLEAAESGIYNAAILVGPVGLVGSYRKIHLPGLGIDHFVTYGDRPFAVQQIDEVRIGMGICYDSAFPEAMRTLALLGADLIALPTNFPTGAESMADFTLRTRAMENNVYFAACNRVGEERGFRFIGGSQLCDPAGNWIVHGSDRDEEILYGEIDPARARTKQVVRVPGKHTIDRFADRRPEMYERLIQPHQLATPERGRR
jgi:predicted amidohydrolase